MQLFDTHTHYYDDAFDTDRDAILSGFPDREIESKEPSPYLLSLYIIFALLLTSFLLIANQCMDSHRTAYIPENQPDGVEGYGVSVLTELESLYYDSERNQAERFAQKIYRKIVPNVDATSDDFRAALHFIQTSPFSFEYINMTSVGDVLCPLLYSNSIVEMTDDSLSTIFEEEGFTASICRTEHDGYTVRIISIGLNPDGIASKDFIENYHYIFIQTWNDRYIWVQPFSEMYGHDEIKEVFLEDKDEEDLYMCLIGSYEYPRNGNAIIGYSLKFTGEFWVPCQFDSIPQVDFFTGKYEQLIRRTEGFIVSGK